MNSQLFHSLLVFVFSSEFVAAQSPTLPRWGQAASLVQDTLFVHAGRVDQYNSYSYSSAPVSDDLFSLPLSSSFSTSSPPWQYIGGCPTCLAPSGPAVAWHTLSAFNTSDLLLFGGDPGPNSPVVLPERPDSVTLLDIDNRQAPSWDFVAESWANQPLRRMYHSASSSRGNIWIVGGLKTDGSNMAFSEHYLFDPHGPSFTQLTTTNAPPDIYGHASLVLSTGQLLVFGGYSPSQDTMFHFDTIWAIDTTQSSPTWSTLSVSNSTLPVPRRGFAATVIPGDKVLVQGGGDSVLQTIYSDGWILDTSQNPMVWSPVDALSQVGPRVDHLAVSVGSTVIFGFGYSGSSAAPSSLSVFDTLTSTFLSSYVPPSPGTFSSITTLPAATPSSAPHSGNSPQHSASATPARPSPSSGSSNGTSGDSPPSSTIANPHTTVIALGTVFGVVALLVGTTGITWYMRQHKRSQETFHLLSPSSDDGSPHIGPVIPVAGAAVMREKGEAPVARTTRDRLYSLVQGRLGTSTQEQRRDMLADEDTRQFDAEFGWAMPSQSSAGLKRGTSSGQSSWRSIMKPATLTDRVHDSLVSLRNVGGAVLGYATGSAGGKSGRRDASGGSRSTGWRGEKEASDPFADNYGVGRPLPSPAPRMGRQGPSFSYKDPFEDYEVEPFNYDYDPRGGYIRESVDEDGYPALLDPPPRPYLPAKLPPPIAVDLTHLTPVSEKPSLSSVTEANNTPTGSSQSLPHTSTTLENSTSSSNSSNSHDHTPRSPPRKPSSIIDANPPSAIPIRRSNSWWTRFAKTPLLDRRLSGSTTTGRSSHGPIEIRDPNPLPRLVPIKESSGPSPENSHIRSTSGNGDGSGNHRQYGSGGSGRGGSGRRHGHGHGQVYSTHQHGRSASSFQTSRTADSETIERMGRTMDIIQRGSYYSDRSFSTERERSESGGTPEPPPPVPPIPPLSIITQMAAAAPVVEKDSHRVGSSALDDEGMLVQSPEDLLDDLSTTIKGRPLGGPSSPPVPSSTTTTGTPSSRQKSKSPTGNGNVASRVQAFEKRLSEQREQEEVERARSPTPKRFSVLPSSPSAAAIRTTSPVGKTRPRASVYGVVPKPSLFVANPDLRERSASD